MTTKKAIKKNGTKSPLAVGNSVMIRTVTMYYTGRIVELSEAEIVLEDAAWIADAGRWSDALTTGKLNEVEPYPDAVTISRGSLIDACRWTHPLPREKR